MSEALAEGPPRRSGTVVLGLLLALMAMPADAAGNSYHTSPACWDAPRIHHAGAPSGDLAARVRLKVGEVAPASGAPTLSPNGAYRFWAHQPDTARPGPWNAVLVADTERPGRVSLFLRDVAQPIAPRWINEKLIFLRVAWGRTVFSDLLLDVEQAKVIYHEEARDGAIAFEQFRQGCGAECPCAASGDAAPLPSAAPGKNAVLGLILLPGIFGPPETGGVVAAEQPVPLPVYAVPRDDAPAITVLRTPEDVEYREYTYEGAAAVVYEARPPWYRIGVRAALPGSLKHGWIKVDAAGDFMPVDDLLTRSMTFLNREWDGRLWSEPEAGARPATSTLRQGAAAEDDEFIVDVQETRRVGDGLWLRVQTFDQSPCEGGTPKVVDTGWVPAYSANGKLTAWFYSRGC
ncbi:hypothetical protein [Emcibacter sp. SYSU 3D8]|uniref:hypothetical protein n=1 Tax=Emcibacter sp. SYSU 3D8 TaxID=3133969 RepID=UPI0031FE51D0